MSTSNRSLAQTLAVQSQVHLPGTVGRLLKQIRDLERVAPLFVKAGLVRAVERPNPISTWASGIATQALTTRTIGGFLYGAAAFRCDLLVEHNAISTAGQRVRDRRHQLRKPIEAARPRGDSAGVHACRSRGCGGAREAHLPRHAAADGPGHGYSCESRRR